MSNQVVLVSFPGDKHHVAFPGEQAGRPDSLFAIHDGERLSSVVGVQPGQHVVDDGLRLLKPWVVRGDDEAVAAFGCFLRHEGAFPFVPVATGSYHRDDFPFPFEHVVYGVEHVGKRVGRMGIVHNGGKPLGRSECLEPAGYRVQRAEGHKHLFFRPSQEHGGTEYGQQVVGIEPSNKLYSQLVVVEVEQHPVEMRFQDASLEVA